MLIDLLNPVSHGRRVRKALAKIDRSTKKGSDIFETMTRSTKIY
jgi:hypothetical protein